ncbi:MAG: hypothetical protein WCO12_01310 [bacterium]
MSLHDIKICVSGAAETSHCGKEAYERAKEIGREIARQGATIMSGATTGFPYWSSIGAKEANGFSIGLSPASNEDEHIHAYRLPTENMDLIIYTGFGFSGRNLMLTRSSDAVIVGCGRIGTINEFTIAFEDNKPIGILEGPWMADDIIRMIIENSNRPHSHVVFDKDPKKLIEKVIQMVMLRKKGVYQAYKNYDGVEGDSAKSSIL